MSKTKLKPDQIQAERSKPVDTFPAGIHYFYAPDVWFVDTTQVPHIVYVRDAQVKVQPGKFYFYNELKEVVNV